MNQEQCRETQANIIEKVEKVLDQEELEFLSNLIQNSNIKKDQREQIKLKQQQDEIEDSKQEVWNQKQEQHRRFLRKVPNFFLAMFKKWLSQQGFHFECQFLEQIRNLKKSKQRRYELCDFKLCFTEQNKIETHVIDLKSLFIEFLKKGANNKIINSKKVQIKNKSKYLQHIEQLLLELKDEQPFKNYYKLVPSKDEKRKFQEDDSFYNSMTKRTHLESSQSNREDSYYSDPFNINFSD